MFACIVPAVLTIMFVLVQTPSPDFVVLDGAGFRLAAFPVGVLTSAEAAVRQLRPVAFEVPGLPKEAHVILANGDRVCGRVVGGDARQIVFKTPFGESESSIPLSRIAAVWWSEPPAELPADPARYPLLAGPKLDSILLADRDVRGGLIERVTNQAVVFVQNNKTESIAVEQVRAVVFDPALLRERKPTGTMIKVTLGDGSRLTFGELTSDGKTLIGKTTWGATLTIRVSEVRLLERVGIPDAEPKVLLPTMEPYNGDGLRPCLNHTTAGRLLKLPGYGVVDRGAVLPAGSDLVFKLGGKFRKFYATIGLESGTHGSATFQLLLDGKELQADANPLLPGVVVPLTIDVSAAAELRLSIRRGPLGNFQSRVVLAAPCGIR